MPNSTDAKVPRMSAKVYLASTNEKSEGMRKVVLAFGKIDRG